MFNKVIMLGRITQDLELKTTPSGVSVLSFSIAVDRRYQEKDKDKKSDFFNCIAWRNEAEFISRFWTKGSPILVEGELQNRKYTDKNGVERYVTEIIVDRACFTGSSKNGGGHSSAPLPDEPPQYQSKSAAPTEQTAPPSGNPVNTYTAADFAVTATDDDYPF